MPRNSVLRRRSRYGALRVLGKIALTMRPVIFRRCTTENSLPISGPVPSPSARPAAALRATAAALLMSIGFSTGAGNAVANGDTRTIYLYHQHTKESIAATYLVGGRYDSEVLKQLNWFLRDWRRDEPTTMDPRLFDVVWETYRSAGAGTNPVVVMSAYRSPETNAMLRHRSRGVARHSQHMLGKAMDTSMPGMAMEQIREIGMKMQRGGVGYYPTAGTPFVHLDVGSVRSWPRMNYDNLVRLFPDGKTVHLPSNGQPLARYEEARAELEAGGNVYLPPSSKSKSFFAFLFGGGGEDDDDGPAPAPVQRGRSRLATAPSRGAQIQVASYAPANNDPNDDGSRSFFSNDGRGAASPQVSRAESNLPRGETFMAPTAPQPAPVQAAAPAPAAQPEKTQVAALDPAAIKLPKPQADDDAESALALAAAPMPPRRPDDLPTFAAFAPLPPSRPSEFTPLAYNQPLASASLRRDPIAEMIAVNARRPDVVGSIHRSGAIGLRTAVFAPTPPSRGENVRDIVPARLDRSNFKAMTDARPAARMTTQTVLGSGAIGARSAARARSAALKPEPQAPPSRFSTRANDLSTSKFVAPQGRQRAALTNAPPSKAN
jgi:uncharacterized protein YcbK (DUF882 family)